MVRHADNNKSVVSSAKQDTTVRRTPPAKAAVRPAEKMKKNGKKGKKAEEKKKIVRDFSIPEAEYKKLDELKRVCLDAGMRVKKTDLLRAGLFALTKLDVPQLKRALTHIGKAGIVCSKKNITRKSPKRLLDS